MSQGPQPDAIVHSHRMSCTSPQSPHFWTQSPNLKIIDGFMSAAFPTTPSILGLTNLWPYLYSRPFTLEGNLHLWFFLLLGFLSTSLDLARRFLVLRRLKLCTPLSSLTTRDKASCPWLAHSAAYVPLVSTLISRASNTGLNNLFHMETRKRRRKTFDDWNNTLHIGATTQTAFSQFAAATSTVDLVDISLPRFLTHQTPLLEWH